VRKAALTTASFEDGKWLQPQDSGNLETQEKPRNTFLRDFGKDQGSEESSAHSLVLAL
jgi:hypothetical protein